MNRIQRTLRVFLFFAASMLVVNDCARLVLPLCGISLTTPVSPTGDEEENNPVNAYSIFEEEVKHKTFNPTFSFQIIAGNGLEPSIVHLIKDDEVRHLAYLAIFSPPPDLA